MRWIVKRTMMKNKKMTNTRKYEICVISHILYMKNVWICRKIIDMNIEDT